MQDPTQTTPAYPMPQAASPAGAAHADEPGLTARREPRPVDSMQRALPYILVSIFGLFAIAITILWVSIGLWARPDPVQLSPDNLTPGQPAPYAVQQPEPPGQTTPSR